MTREELREKAISAIDKGIAAPRIFVGSDEKAVLVAVRATMYKSLANEVLDDVIEELAKRA